MFKVHTDETIRELIHDACHPYITFVNRGRKLPTRAGLLALLEQLVSPHYNAEESRDELPVNEHYNAAYNAQWLTADDPRWSGGTKYRRHRITTLGRAVLQVMREDDRVPYDEYSAEWLDAEARADAQQAERARRTAVLRAMQDDTAIDDMRAERDAQRVGVA